MEVAIALEQLKEAPQFDEGSKKKSTRSAHSVNSLEFLFPIPHLDV